MLGSFVYTIAKKENKRQVFTLPCGAGKTTAIRGFCKAIHDLGRSDKIVICAEKIEGLCSLKRDLIDKDGISEDKVSLIHSYTHVTDFDPSSKDSTASEPSDHNEPLRQFVLLSHSKLQQGFDKLDHDLLIHDEALLLGAANTVTRKALSGEIGMFRGVVDVDERATTSQNMVSAWLSDVLQVLKQAEDGCVLSLPSLPMSISEAKKTVRSIVKADSELTKFLAAVHEQADIRIMKEGNQGSCLVNFQQTIPDHLNDIAVLDATFSNRELMVYGKSLKAIEFGDNIKNHSKVTIHTFKARAGRQYVLKQLANKRDLNLFAEVADIIITNLKAGKKVLCFTFKDAGEAKPIMSLNAHIEAQLGHNIDQLQSHNNLSYLTWGYETALNNYSHCDVVIFAGMMTLPHAAVAGRVFAQAGDINMELNQEDLDRVVHTEKTHAIYQALNRGSCRGMVNGEAKEMDVYLFSDDHMELRQTLGEMMPGVVFKDYPNPKHLTLKITKKDLCKEAIIKFLDNFDGDKISSQRIFEGCPGFTQRTKQEALKDLLSARGDLVFIWERVGRSLIRVPEEQ